MSWLMASIYDRFLAASEEHGVRAWRQALLELASGESLEVGAGTGLNLPLYASQGISALTLLEPDAHMRQKLAQRIAQTQAPYPISVSEGSLDALPFEDARFETVICTLVLCSVPSQARALAEIWRVLKPGGKLLYLEHIAATDNPSRYRLQRLVEPGWRCVAGNCHLTRHTKEALIQAGFTLEDCQHQSMPKAMPFLRPTIRGAALKARA